MKRLLVILVLTVACSSGTDPLSVCQEVDGSLDCSYPGHFSSVDLSGRNLRNIDLSIADLSRANLRRADLSGANLSGTNLREAYLYRAHLSGAHLYGANFERAHFEETDFERARADEKTVWPKGFGFRGQVGLFDPKFAGVIFE